MNLLGIFGTEASNANSGAGAAEAEHQTVYAMNDPFGNLPKAAREKLRAIRDESSDRHAVTRPLADEINEMRSTIYVAEAQYRRILENRHVQEHGQEDHPSARAQRAKLEGLREEFARLQQRYDSRIEEWQHWSATASELENYAKDSRGARLTMAADLPPHALQPGETYVEAVSRERKEIEALREALLDTKDAPQPSSIAKARVREQISALAETGKANVWGVVEHEKGTLKFPTTQDSKNYRVRAFPEALATLAWLFEEQLIAKVEAEIDAIADDSEALGPEERAKRLSELSAEILRHERIEEQLIERAAESNIVIPRRRDADPRAVLGLADSAPAPRK